METWQAIIGVGIILYLLIGVAIVTECYQRYELSSVRHKIFKNPINAVLLVAGWPIVAMEI